MKDVVKRQITIAKNKGIPNEKIYEYYFLLRHSTEANWVVRWRHPLRPWYHESKMSIIEHLIDANDEQVLDSSGKIRPSMEIKAFAIIIKEL